MNAQSMLNLIAILLKRIEDSDIKVQYVQMDDQLADFLNGAVPRIKLSNALSSWA